MIHYCVGAYSVKYLQSLLTIEELSIIDEIDGGQITLELYVFGSSKSHSSSDPVATTNYMCFNVLHDQDIVLVKRQSRIIDTSTTRPLIPRYYGSHLIHGEKCYTKMQLNMATACDPRIT